MLTDLELLGDMPQVNQLPASAYHGIVRRCWPRLICEVSSDSMTLGIGLRDLGVFGIVID